MQTITIAAPKGGAGKTTTTTLLATHALHLKKRVALFDLNSDQGNIPQWLAARGKLPSPTFIEIEDIVQDAKVIAKEFDFLFVDTPPVIDDLRLIEAAVQIADFVVVPCRPSILDIGAQTALIELCEAKRKPFAFVLCDVTNTWKSLNQSAREALEADFGKGCVLDGALSHRLAYVNAMTVGKTGAELDASCKDETAKLWGEIATRMRQRHGR